MSGKNSPDIGKICQKLNSHLKNKFGIGLEKTVLCTYNNEEWKVFLEIAGLDSNYSGFYSPKMRCAHIPEEHPLALQLIYHEYFGTGCTRSILKTAGKCNGLKQKSGG